MPVFPPRSKRPLFYIANRAHHADVGGAHAGSMGLSREIFEEGFRIPPVKIMRKGRILRDVLALLLANGNSGYRLVTRHMGGKPSGIAIADFDGDGKADIAVSNSAGDSVTLLLRR